MKALVIRFLKSDAARLFARDAAEAALAAIASLVLTIPASLDEAKSEALIVSVAVLSAVLAVARRELLPLVKAFVSAKLAKLLA